MIDLIRFGILQSLDYWTAKHPYKLYLRNKKVEDRYASWERTFNFKEYFKVLQRV
jgi:hypothetical protein